MTDSVRGNFNALKEIVLEHSESSRWEFAKREWKIADCYVAESADDYGECLCGHSPIKYMFNLENAINGNELFPIGNVCVKAFDVEKLSNAVDIFIAFTSLGERLIKGEDIAFGPPDFTRRMIHALHEYDVIKPNKWNENDPENDIAFLLTLFNQRSDPSFRSCRKCNAIMDKYVKPFLKRFYLQGRMKKKESIYESVSK